MEIIWKTKTFNELTNRELYEILALRTEVFIVEQNCPFQDSDGEKDFVSYHIFGTTIDNKIVAYARLVPKNISYIEASIGRVVNSPRMRGVNLGKRLLENSIAKLYEIMGPQPIKIGAQYYLKKFYESFGFEKTSEIYLEDGIEHIEMVKKI
jgi:ElaA protein